MSIETAKLELIQWIINLKEVDWLEDVLAFKQKLEKKQPHAYAQESQKSKLEEGLGSYRGKIWMSEDFDEPLEDFKDYM